MRRRYPHMRPAKPPSSSPGFRPDSARIRPRGECVRRWIVERTHEQDQRDYRRMALWPVSRLRV